MSFYSTPLIAWTDRGLYCEAGNFHIDPHRGAENAIVTHAHSDHARRGSRRYLSVSSGVGLLKARLGHRIEIEPHDYGERFTMGSVDVSFHSAGHILGSAQVRVESRISGEVWVASGDYKRDFDPSCDPFEPIRCDTFITEATFGTPKYVWPEDDHGRRIREWWLAAVGGGENAILFGYSLGKAQRILAELAPHADRPILIHETMAEITECYRQEGRVLAATRSLSEALADASDLRPLSGELILAPPSILDQSWTKRLGRYRTAFASGWMISERPHSGSSYDHGFILSDHADWKGLNRTIDETGACRVFVQHREGALIRHLRSRGIDAHPADALRPENYIRLGGQPLSLFG